MTTVTRVSGDTPATPLVDERRARHAELEPQLLPDLQDRLRDGILFLGLTLTLFTFAVLGNRDERSLLRFDMNALRLVILLACWWILRVRRWPRHVVLSIGAIASVTLVFIAAGRAALSRDISSFAVLAVAVASFGATMIPWGVFAQGAFALLWATGYLATGIFVHGGLGDWLIAPMSLTFCNSLVLSVYVASVYGSSRAALTARLEDARKGDEELEQLHHKLELRVRDRTAELELANRELRSFSYTVSHDLRSPLRSIHGFACLVQEEMGANVSPELEGYVDRIRRATNRMDLLIDDMLTLARVGRGEIRRDSVDLSDLARSVIDDLRAEYPERNVDVEIGEIPKVRGDRMFLRLVIDNLVRNSWKFTSSRERARIAVRGEAHDGMVECHVIDDGVGFDMKYAGKLFRPFERLHSREEYEGAGIGLATVARIIQRHGGRVAASARPDRGAEFSFTLPPADA